MLFFSFSDDIKRLPSIQQAAWHEDDKHNLMVLLCSNGECECHTEIGNISYPKRHVSVKICLKSKHPTCRFIYSW